MVFVLGMITIGNANTFNQQVKNCAEIAFNLQGDLEANGVPMEVANNMASIIYDTCVLAGGSPGGLN